MSENIRFESTAPYRCDECGAYNNIKMYFCDSSHRDLYEQSFRCECGADFYHQQEQDTCLICAVFFDYFGDDWDGETHLCEKCKSALRHEFNDFMYSFTETECDFLVKEFDIRNL